MNSTRSCSQGQQQPAQSPVFVSETSFFLTTIDTLYGMADEDDNQRAFNQMAWNEYFQQESVDSEWQASQPVLGVAPRDLDPPSVPDFMDGRMAVTMHPPMPYRPYAPLSDEGIHFSDPLAQPASLSMQANTTYSTALAYHSDETTTNPWFEQLPGSPPNEGGSTYGYNTSTSTPMTVEVKSETPSTASLMEESTSYFTQHISPQWEPLPIQQSSPSHSPGPERSSKAKVQRISPVGAIQISKSAHPKRAVACWRCRKYRKPCDDEAVCTSCQVGNFRVWPPAIGCRRDKLERFALAIIPLSAEDLFRTLSPDLTPSPSWRQSVLNKSLTPKDLFPDGFSEKWSPLAVKAHATGLFGMEMVNLLGITHNYQTRHKTKSPVLESVCTLFSSSCEIYNIFVISGGNQQAGRSRANIAAIIQDIRTSLARSLSLYLGLCVSSKRSDWFPSVLAFAICVAALTTFMDAAVAMPEKTRTELWIDVTQFCVGLRTQLYPTALDLLRIRANNDKQMAPLELACWNWVPEDLVARQEGSFCRNIKSEPDLDADFDLVQSSGQAAALLPAPQTLHKHHSTLKEKSNSGSPTRVRNPEGMRLVGNDEAAFDGFSELQKWVKANENMLKQGKILFANDPFTSPTVDAVCTLAPIFGIR